MRGVGILIFVVILVIVVIVVKYHHSDLAYVKADVDNEYYLVRDLSDRQQASNLLARLKQRIETLTRYLSERRDTEYAKFAPYIRQLEDRIKNVVVLESSEDSVYTSYSVNKGEQIVFCLRSREIKNQLHKLNLLMYVVLHEMAHVACPEYGHTPLFKEIFTFLATVAVSIHLYERIDFARDPTEYCGLTISDSVI